MLVKFDIVRYQCSFVECGKIIYDKQGLKKHIRNVHQVLDDNKLNVKLKSAKIIKSTKENIITLKSKDSKQIDKLKEKQIGEEFLDRDTGNLVRVCLGCPVESCKNKSKSLESLTEHIRKNHNLDRATAHSFSKQAHKDIIPFEQENQNYSLKDDHIFLTYYLCPFKETCNRKETQKKYFRQHFREKHGVTDQSRNNLLMLDVTRTVVEEEIKDKYKWELKPLSNQIIDDENISNKPVLGKIKKLAF